MSLKPLAERMRPEKLEDFIGQEHLLGKNKSLFNLLMSKNIRSMILWGPPGTGKTTLARLIALNINAEYFQLSAVTSGVKDIKEITKKAEVFFQENKKTILFIDEIHRFNKAQQDALLHSVEAGTITLIGATTENPSFEVIPALLSRTVVYILKELSSDNLKTILNNAFKNDVSLRKKKIIIDDPDYLVLMSSGDARILLNGFENCIELSTINKDDEYFITNEIINEAFQKKKINYDKAGEEHYNVISAFIKSMRGSDPDAAIYWLARMIAAGEDPLFIARRMVVFASEDIGNAMPTALLVATSTFNAVNLIGMPEGRIVLGQCATYLASCPKSNSSYMAINNALADLEKDESYPVPLHLRNAPTKFMKDISYGRDYKYPHNYPNHFVDEIYLPETIKNKIYYNPADTGQEKQIKERLSALWKGKKPYK